MKFEECLPSKHPLIEKKWITNEKLTPVTHYVTQQVSKQVTQYVAYQATPSFMHYIPSTRHAFGACWKPRGKILLLGWAGPWLIGRISRCSRTRCTLPTRKIFITRTSARREPAVHRLFALEGPGQRSLLLVQTFKIPGQGNFEK